ncbi:DUF1684 domain-containing protein [Nocardioides sp. GY 10113]|uniref:DUF1684 domain-containing protein n=1 Tax=Nocardioides sp. GY 10113 TaxID=2569761 RepID=UPI001F0EB142|nr:DUF1684 domain-containing protein [Nocardioides sp. GY 10113]
MTQFLPGWHEFREARETRLRSPNGYLAITGLHWLDETPQRFEDVPGAWAQDDRGVTVTLGPDERIDLSGAALTEGTHTVGDLDDEGVRASFDGGSAEVADRDGRAILRPRRADAPHLRAYRETPCYPADPAWALPALFVPYADGGNAPAVGEVVFAHLGREHRLVAWDNGDGSLWLLFRDATSGVTTYAANRQLVAAAPGDGGAVTLDFNRAINMPCAYTEHVTCPLPPASNTLPFPVEAGERIPVMAALEPLGA